MLCVRRMTWHVAAGGFNEPYYTSFLAEDFGAPSQLGVAVPGARCVGA